MAAKKRAEIVRSNTYNRKILTEFSAKAFKNESFAYFVYFEEFLPPV